MPTETTTLAALAGAAYDEFERVPRDEEEITTLRGTAPEWLLDLVRDAHGDFMPDDWRYGSIRAALGAIHDADVQDPDDMDDLAHEFADSNVDVYNGARLAWLASNLNRPGYVDEARDEGLISPDMDVTGQVGVGQYMESLEVFQSVRESLVKRWEDITA